MSLGLAVLRKNLTGDYRQVFAREGLVLCVWQGPRCPTGMTLF